MSNLTSNKSAAITYGRTTANASTISKYQWNWQGQPLTIVYETTGSGTPILLLPSFSTVSSRSEMSGLANLLSPQFQVTTIDFPGFGDSSRLKLDYSPPLYRQFVEDFVRDTYAGAPVTIIAAGHGAGYALNLAASLPASVAKLVLVAPTWRGPLPTMAGGQKPWLKAVRELIRTPILGQFLYQLTTTPSFLAFMYRRHVYADANTLTPELLRQKRQITQQSGARFGAAAFVTGGLDPYLDRSTAITQLQSLTIPVFVAIGASSPPKSKAEMIALSEAVNVTSCILPGTLGLHEEYPRELHDAILSFLTNGGQI